MNTQTIIRKLRASPLSKEKIAVQADVSYSWLTKFLLGKMEHPRESSLEKLRAYLRGTAK